MCTNKMTVKIRTPYYIDTPDLNGTSYSEGAVVSMVNNFKEPAPLVYNIEGTRFPIGTVNNIRIIDKYTEIPDAILVEFDCTFNEGDTIESVELSQDSDSLKGTLGSALHALGIVGRPLP